MSLSMLPPPFLGAQSSEFDPGCQAGDLGSTQHPCVLLSLDHICFLHKGLGREWTEFSW